MYLMRVGDRYYVPHFTYYHVVHPSYTTQRPSSVGQLANLDLNSLKQEEKEKQIQEQRLRTEPKQIVVKRVIIVKRGNQLPRIIPSLSTREEEILKERQAINEAFTRLLLGGEVPNRPEVAYYSAASSQNQQTTPVSFTDFFARFHILEPVSMAETNTNANIGTSKAQERSSTSRENVVNWFVSHIHEFGGTYQQGSTSATTTPTSVSETSGSTAARTPSNPVTTSRFGPNTPYTGSQSSGGSSPSQPTPQPSQSQPQSQQSSSGSSWWNPLSWGQAISQGIQSFVTDVSNAVTSIVQGSTSGSTVASASTGTTAPSTTQSGTPTSASTTSNPVATSRFGPNTPYTNQQSQSSSGWWNPFSSIGQAISQGLQSAANAIKQGLTDINNAINNAYASAYGTQPHQSSNPFQQALNDIAEGSALVGYYLTEGVGGAGEELYHLATTGKFENFGQAVQQFNKANILGISGQQLARYAGDVSEVVLPMAVSAVVAPELLPAEVIGAAANVGLGEAISKLTTGKWQSLGQVLSEANQGAVLGAIGEVGGQLLEAGLARGAGALTKLITGNEELAKNVAALTPVYRTIGGALTNIGLTAPFTSNPQQIAIAGILGALGGLAPGIAGKIMSKIDELRGTGTVAELTTLTSPLTGETTEAWVVHLPNGDTVYITPKFTFGEGDVEDFIRQYGNKESLLIHTTPSKSFLENVAKGEELIKVTGSIENPSWQWREWLHLQDLYLSPGESPDTGVALTGYIGIRDTQPGIPSFPRYGQSSIREVFSRFINPFDIGGMIGVKDSPLVFRPPQDLVDYILQRKAYYESIGWDPRDINNQVVKDLLNDPRYGPMVKQWLNEVRTQAAQMGKSYIGLEDVLGISHERQVEIPAGAKLKGTGFTYNIWIRQTPVLLRDLPGPLRDILSDWYRLRYVEADIVPGLDALNKFEDQNTGGGGGEGGKEGGGEGGYEGGGYGGGEGGKEGGGGYEDRGGYEYKTGYDRLWYYNRINETTRSITTLPRSHSVPISRSHTVTRSHSITIPRSHSVPISRSHTVTRSHSITIPHSHSVPLSHSIRFSTSIRLSTSPPISTTPPPVYNYQYEYVVYSPPVVITPEYVPSNYEQPMGPPPIMPPFMPGGFGGGGGNNQTISGMAGEIIRL